MSQNIYAVINRDASKYQAPGTWTFYDGDEELGSWPCITGHKELDPTVLGGPTPSSYDDEFWWVPIERLEKRKHPRGHYMPMSRLVPCGDFSRYGKRTTMVDDLCVAGKQAWPFMSHKGTRDEEEELTYASSSGCPAVYERFEQFQDKFNELYDSGHRFPIYVREI